MSTKLAEERTRQAESAMGDLAKDIGLKHEAGGLKDEAGPGQAQQSVKQTIGRLFGRGQRASRKQR